MHWTLAIALAASMAFAATTEHPSKFIVLPLIALISVIEIIQTVREDEWQ